MKKGRLLLTAVGAAVGLVGYRLASQAYQQMSAQTPPFEKQTLLTETQLIEVFESFWRHPEALASLRANASLTSSLADQIMLAVSGAFGASQAAPSQRRYALRSGMPSAMVDAITRGNVAHMAQDEAPALSFARHYAETRGNPDPDLVERLVDTYGGRTSQDLITYIRLVSGVALVGNTIDAFVSRLLGQPSSQTTLSQEIKILTTFFFGILPLTPVLALRVAMSGSEE